MVIKFVVLEFFVLEFVVSYFVEMVYVVMVYVVMCSFRIGKDYVVVIFGMCILVVEIGGKCYEDEV